MTQNERETHCPAPSLWLTTGGVTGKTPLAENLNKPHTVVVFSTYKDILLAML